MAELWTQRHATPGSEGLLTAGAGVRNRGSVLLEHLVAVSLLGVLAVSIFALLGTGSLAAQLSRKLSVAGELAAGKIEQFTERCEGPAEVAREPLDPERFPGYQWQSVTEEVSPGLCQVTVTVWWPLRGQQRSFQLTTLIRRQEEP